MDDIVHLGDNSQCPSTQVPMDADYEIPSEFVDAHVQALFMSAGTRGVVPGGGRSNTARSPSATSHSQAGLPHKVQGPNWTEAEMLVLIG